MSKEPHSNPGLAGAGKQAAGPSGPRKRRPPARVRRRRYGILLLAGIAVLIVILVAGRRGSPPQGEAVIHINPGDSAVQIADTLASQDVIDSKDDFIKGVADAGATEKLKAGVYRFQRGEAVSAIVADLEAGRQAPDEVLVIPEGYSAADIAKAVSLRKPIPAADYLNAAKPAGRQLPLAGAAGAGSLEGFLFPSTYDLDTVTSAPSLVDQQLAAFASQTAGLDWSGAAGIRTAPSSLTPYQILIVASLVEREAKVPEERPEVAAVIYNRIAAGMKLEVDATVQYALGYWKSDLTAQDLAVDSPYNTRLYPGLPPGPICNPGVASIKAALTPAKVDYLYYVATGDAAGHHFFTSSYDDFLKAKASRQG